MSEEGAERQKSLKINANENHFTLREVYISRVSEEEAKRPTSLKTKMEHDIFLERGIHFRCFRGGSEETNIIEKRSQLHMQPIIMTYLFIDLERMLD